ncbi:MAG: hypothetical protein CMB20_001790 [Methanobacteriota archaeon]|nr:MAG: hypothetical protein CMB20_001790 [Euryarchaeota archaeon]
MPVLDTAALLHWPVEKIAGNLVANSQMTELENLSPERAMLVEALDLRWESPDTKDAEIAAAKTGDLPRLSPVDLDVIAIAINSNEILYTDDYSMQNVCRFLGLEFQPVFNQKSKKQWFWQLKCIGCRATKEIEIEKEETCEICGSPMKVKKARR